MTCAMPKDICHKGKTIRLHLQEAPRVSDSKGHEATEQVLGQNRVAAAGDELESGLFRLLSVRKEPKPPGSSTHTRSPYTPN